MKRSIPIDSFWNAAHGLLPLLLTVLTLGWQTPSMAVTKHVVRPGESLWGIANRYGVSQEVIRSTNRMPTDQVVSGSTLTIPTPGGSSAPRAGSTLNATPGTHIVRPGQTFSGIARSYGLSMVALQAANPGVSPEPLLVDTRLAIPKAGSKTPKTQPPVPPAPASNPQRSSALDYPPAPGKKKAPRSSSATHHTVRPGDTLTGLAVTYGVSSSAIQNANKIANPNVLTVGQRLNIPGTSKPASPTAPVSYRPKPVAPPAPTAPPPPMNTAPAPPKQVATAGPNPIKPSGTTSKPKRSSSFTETHRAVLAYRLEKGDSLDTVANLFGTTPERLRELNKLPPGTNLGAGDELVVPAMASVSN